MKKYFYLLILALLVAVLATANVALKSNAPHVDSATLQREQDKYFRDAASRKPAPAPVFLPNDTFKDAGDTRPFGTFQNSI